MNIIITNQSHISHGRITLEDYQNALDTLLYELEAKNVKIADIYTCPHARRDHCDCKKPKTFFVEKAIEKYNLIINECYVVGDSGKNDMLLAHKAGAKSVLVLTGEGINSITETRNLWDRMKPTYIAENSLDAIEKIIETYYFISVTQFLFHRL